MPVKRFFKDTWKQIVVLHNLFPNRSSKESFQGDEKDERKKKIKLLYLEPLCISTYPQRSIFFKG